MGRTERKYGRRIRTIHPLHDELEARVTRHGINGFYDSKETRIACCHVRKVGARAWMAGLRGDQSAHRQGMGIVEFVSERGLLKLNPLFDWTRDAVLAFATENGIPINPLHAEGFASIGCAPCTRALQPGEPERAGRWWRENENTKECGLHLSRR